MPTENRSSNPEMVSVLRELIAKLEQFGEGSTPARAVRRDVLEQVYAVLAQSAEQHQGEPVAPWYYFADCADPDYSCLFHHETEALTQVADHGGEVVKLWNVPPYPDPGEIERLRAALESACNLAHARTVERDTLRAQVAERDALLRDLEGKTILSWPDKHRISAALSASAEPSAPVERDERAQFEAAYCDYFNALPSVSTPITPEQVKETRQDDHYGHGSLGKNLRWAGWQMRAALERKP